VRENVLTVDDLIYPVFVLEGKTAAKRWPACPHRAAEPGSVAAEAAELVALGIPAIALFPVVGQEHKSWMPRQPGMTTAWCRASCAP
jgi:porphobilinogen synthase